MQLGGAGPRTQLGGAGPMTQLGGAGPMTQLGGRRRLRGLSPGDSGEGERVDRGWFVAGGDQEEVVPGGQVGAELSSRG